MSNLRIQDYIDIDSIDGSELMLVSKSGSYRKTTIEEIRNLAADITNTALADLVGKIASAQDVKNILTNINGRFLNSTGYGIISGGVVTAQSTPNMTVSVTDIVADMPNGTNFSVSGNNSLSISGSDTTNSRVDVVYVAANGIISYLEGIPASSPVAPSIPDGAFLLYEINVAAGITSITNSNLVDKRKFKNTTDNLASQLSDIVQQQIPNKSKTVSDTNVLYVRALSDIAKNINLNAFKTVTKALITGTLRIAFVGDSITEGIDQVTDDDKYANKLMNALQKTLSNVAITWTNFGLNGRGIGQFNSDSYVATNPETNTSNNFWRSWSVAGKSWRQHIKDFEPDVIIFAFGMNDAGTNINANQNEYNNLVIAKEYFESFNKVPDIALIPTYLPTKDQNEGEVPWFTQTQEATISVARATREFGKQYGYPIIDVNRTFCILRDGIDYDGYYGYIDGLSDNLVGDTTQFNIEGNTIQAKSGAILNSKIYSDSETFYDGDISCNVTVTPSDNNDGVAQLFYRWKEDRGGYLVQVEPNADGNFSIQLYSFNNSDFNSSGVIKALYNISTAITSATTISVNIKIRGARHTILVNGSTAIDIYDYDHLANGYVGVCSNSNTTTGIVNELTCVYFKPYTTNTGLYTEDELLGVNYNNDPQSGNAINHLSGLGYSLVYEPILFSLADKIGILNNTKNKKIIEVCNGSDFTSIASGNAYWDTTTTDGKNILYYVLTKKLFNQYDEVTALDLTSFKPFNLNSDIQSGLQLHSLNSGEIAYLKSQPTDNKALIFIREDDKPTGKIAININ